MHLSHDALILAPTDLSAFLGCRHRCGLDLAVAHGLLKKPTWTSPTLQALQDRGAEHERQYIESLRAKGLRVVDISVAGAVAGGNGKPDTAARVAATLEAIREGVEVIVQGALEHADPVSGHTWRGYADVLQRVDCASALGAWSYEVYDTKLARETRGGTILQLAVYSELLAAVQGIVPEHFHVVTPEPNHPLHTFRVNDYAAYFRLLRANFLATLVLGQEAIRGAHYPEPVEQCEVCRWWERCNARRRADDHLSFIANCGRLHRAELQAHGIATLAAAARMPLPLTFRPTRGSGDTYERLREQARLQLAQRDTGQPTHELLDVEPGRGLARLPAPSPGDLFLDLEAARFACEGGREYLFGLWSAATGYRAWWATDAVEERAAFEAVMAVIMSALAADPGMHVYHFGHYETSAFKRLMGRHALGADDLDRLLRGERFVNLHTIVAQALRAGVESYSIKKLEPFYGFTRDVDLREASANLQAIELALEAATPGIIPEEVRAAVGGYNRDDCRSTQALRVWLESLRAGLEAAGTPVARPEPQGDAPPEDMRELDAEVAAIRAQLLADLAPEAMQPEHPLHPRWLLAYLIDWHRREDKAQWWDYYRIRELDDEALLDEGKAIARLAFVQRVDTVKHKKTGKPTGSVIDRYGYPIQECEIGRRCTLTRRDGARVGEVEAIDRSARLIDIRKGPTAAEEHADLLFDKSVVRSVVVQRSVMRLASDFLATPRGSDLLVAPRGSDLLVGPPGGIPGNGPSTCGLDLLFRHPPRLAGGLTFEQARRRGTPGETDVDFAVRIVSELDRSTLAIQGPPGAGKTYAGARMIRQLVSEGRRVGVTAVSHKVIRNLLDEVAKQARADGETVRLGRRVNEERDETGPVREFTDNDEAVDALHNGEVDVLGGTAWLWSREPSEGTADVLFIDEAGQMSLAYALAVSRAATNLVLLGDPQQLEQPQKASHPPGCDVSALEHVLGGEKTMAREQGIFLPVTWRLAPAVCRFTSEVFYEGRLHARDGLEQQRLTGAGPFDGAGLWWVPVDHDGNQNSSMEEVDVVAQLVERLLAPGVCWENDKGEAQPLTAADLRIVAPYNAQVNRLAERLEGRGVAVGTVDKFQGQEAPVVIYSMATSRPEDAPRGMEFLYSLNRLNVATSRARCAAIVVASPRLFEPECRTPRQMQLANALCRFRELAQ